MADKGGVKDDPAAASADDVSASCITINEPEDVDMTPSDQPQMEIEPETQHLPTDDVTSPADAAAGGERQDEHADDVTSPAKAEGDAAAADKQPDQKQADDVTSPAKAEGDAAAAAADKQSEQKQADDADEDPILPVEDEGPEGVGWCHPYHLPDDLKFAYTPHHAQTEGLKKKVGTITEDTEAYGKLLSDLKARETFQAEVLLLPVDDCATAGHPNAVKKQETVLNRNTDLVHEQVQYNELADAFKEAGIVRDEQHQKYSKLPSNNEKMTAFFQDLLSGEPTAFQEFLSVLWKNNKRDVYNKIWEGEGRKVKMTLSYAEKMCRFSKESGSAGATAMAAAESMETDEALAAATCLLARGDAGERLLSGPGLEIPALMIRYVHLNAHGTALLLSYWPHADRQRVRNVIIHTNPDDVAGMLTLVNALRLLIYVHDDNTPYRLDAFRPLCATFVRYKFDAEPGPAKFERTPIGRVWETKYVMLDEEALNVFAEDSHEVCDEWFKFQTETDGHSTEKVYFHGPMGFIIQLIRDDATVFLNLLGPAGALQKQMYDAIRTNFRIFITPKIKSTWHFDDVERLKTLWEEVEQHTVDEVMDDIQAKQEDEQEKAMSRRYLPLRETDDQPSPGTSTGGRDAAPGTSTGGRDAAPGTSRGGRDAAAGTSGGGRDAAPGTSRGGLDTAPGTSRSGLDAAPSTSGGFLDAAAGTSADGWDAAMAAVDTEDRLGDADEVSNVDVETLVMQLETCDVKHADDETQTAWLTWFTAAEKLITSNTVPISSIESAGLDVNDYTHFRRAIEKIKDEMTTLESASVAEVVANMRGISKIFKESKLHAITRWLAENTEEKRLMQVFLVTLT